MGIMMILAGHIALRCWALLSSRGGIGAVHGLVPLTPRDLRDQALPRRRGPVPVWSPTTRDLGLVESLGLTDPSLPTEALVGSRDSRRLLPQVRFHTCSQEIPARSLYPVFAYGQQVDGLFVCSPELAACQVFARDDMGLFKRLQLLMGLTGSYRLVGDELRSHCPPIATTQSLRSFASKAKGIRGRLALARTIPFLLEGSASPAETDLAIALSLPLRHGGARLGRPALNRKLRLNPQAQAILGRETITPDLLFFGPKAPPFGFPVEYESIQEHSDEEQAAYDELRRNTYAAMGSGCFLARPKHLKSEQAFDAMAAVVAKNTGRRLAPLSPQEAKRHRDLLAEALERWRRRPDEQPLDDLYGEWLDDERFDGMELL